MIAKAYLTVVSLLYFALAIWCTVAPHVTAGKVGFQLNGGSGQSEFVTVYGGLEFGMALIFLLAVFREETVGYGLLACVIIHTSLVVFRTASFARYSEIESFTYRLAAGEWVIALVGATLLIARAKADYSESL
jgi:hypothetical protein